jgi:hypothetical protein
VVAAIDPEDGGDAVATEGDELTAGTLGAEGDTVC